MTTAQIRKEYGSIKAALEHCNSLNMDLSGVCRQLQVSRQTVVKWETRFHIHVHRSKRGRKKGCENISGFQRMQRTNYLKALERRGYPLHDPETIYQAERLAGMRGV